MLFDRPYREALTVMAVQQQLKEYSGRQLSPRIVDAALRAELVGEYAAIMRGVHRAGGVHGDRILPGVSRQPKRRAFS